MCSLSHDCHKIKFVVKTFITYITKKYTFYSAVHNVERQIVKLLFVCVLHFTIGRA